MLIYKEMYFKTIDFLDLQNKKQNNNKVQIYSTLKYTYKLTLPRGNLNQPTYMAVIVKKYSIK